MCFRSGEKTGGLQATSVSQSTVSGARCVICFGVPPLMLAQICGVCLLSYCVQAKACGGAGVGVRVAGGIGCGVVPGRRLGDGVPLTVIVAVDVQAAKSSARIRG